MITFTKTLCVLAFSKTNLTLKKKTEKKKKVREEKEKRQRMFHLGFGIFFNFLYRQAISHISLYVIQVGHVLGNLTFSVLSLVYSYQGIIKIRRLQVQLDTLKKLGKMPIMRQLYNQCVFLADSMRSQYGFSLFCDFLTISPRLLRHRLHH